MTGTKRPDGGDLEPLCLIDARLEDLAQANVVHLKSPRLDAMDKIARNDREISWLKDLRSTLLLTRTPTNESPAPQPPVEGLREALEDCREYFTGKRRPELMMGMGHPHQPKLIAKIDRALAALASPSLTAGENTKSDGRVQALCRTGESEPSVTQAYRLSDPSPSDGGDVVMCVCCGKPAIGKCEGGLLPKGLFDSAKAAVHREMRAIHEFTGFASSDPPDAREAIARNFIAIMQRHLRIERSDSGYIVGWSEAADALLHLQPAKGER